MNFTVISGMSDSRFRLSLTGYNSGLFTIGTVTMRDMNCKKCGEPYSAYALKNDVSDWEDQPDDAYEEFMRGNGCPTCDWGEKAGEVSLSKSEDSEDTESRHFESVFHGTDDDPVKYL